MTTYRLYSNGSEVTTVMGRPLDDEDEAKDVAQELSAKQGSEVTVVSVLPDRTSAEWTRIVAVFRDGKPHPWVWLITYLGAIPEAVEIAAMSEAGGSYLGAGSDHVGGKLRAGLQRQRFAVDAASGEEAQAKARAALRLDASNSGDWTFEPADDAAIRMRLDDARPKD